MTKQTQIVLIGISVAIFATINLFSIANGNFLFSLLPLALAIILLAFLSIENILLLLMFLTPLSVRLREYDTAAPFDIALPTEPFLVIITGIFILKILSSNSFDKRIFKHPISFAIYIYLAWMLITCITSTHVLISFKQFVAQLWFISCYYFIAAHIFKNTKTIKNYLWAYLLGLLIVCIYTITNHALYNFSHKASYWVMSPFYNDHTSYGAVLAFVLPIIFGLKSIARRDFNINFFYWVTIFIITTALIFSQTRAAWISIVGIIGIWIITKLKIKFSSLLIIGILATLTIAPFYTDIMISMRLNEKESSGNFDEHIKSISNISSDASNMERINRWHCAIKMFTEKPIFGWGPGTYMFEYAPFQSAADRTIISTNAGTLGNAHSEYLGRLAEMGIIGLLLFVVIIGITLYYGFMLSRYSSNKTARILALSLILGLITYYMHSFLNNFLDIDKVTSLFWGSTAILVALDIYHNPTANSGEQLTS